MAGALALIVLAAAPVASASSVLTPVAGSPFSTGSGSGPAGVAFSSDGSQLASANNSGNTMSLFSVGTGGSLTPVRGSPVTTGSAPNGIAADPSASLFAVANTGPDTVSVFSGVFQVSGSPFSDEFAPAKPAYSRNGQFLAVANVGPDVSMFSVGSNGALTPVPGTPFNEPSAGGFPGSVSFSPSGNLLAAANGGLTEFSVASNGALTPLSGVGTASVSASQAAYSPTGQFLAAVAYSQPGILAIYSVAANGALSLIGTILHPSIDTWTVAFSPNGQLLAVGSLATNAVDLYSVSPTGGLTLLPGSPYPVGGGPQALAFNPSGTLLAVTSKYANTVSVFAVGSSGAQAPSNRFSISRLRVRRNGTITVWVKVPGPGAVDVLETVPKAEAASLRPAKDRLAFARKRVVAARATTLHLTVAPNSSGRALLARLGTISGLRLWLRYTPRGGRPRSLARYGLTIR